MPEPRVLELTVIKDWKILAIFETEENNLDFNYVCWENFENESEFKFTFEQLSELKPRKENQIKNDPVVKVSSSYNEEAIFTISLKKSGLFDLYWEGQMKFSSVDIVDLRSMRVKKQDSSEERNHPFLKNVQSNMNAFYMQSVDGTCLELYHNGIGSFDFS